MAPRPLYGAFFVKEFARASDRPTMRVMIAIEFYKVAFHDEAFPTNPLSRVTEDDTPKPGGASGRAIQADLRRTGPVACTRPG